MPTTSGSSVILEAETGASTFVRSDAGNGEYFARLYGERVRFDHRRNRWLVWAGHWWRDDETDQVRQLAKKAARERYDGAPAIGDLRQRTDEARFAIASENRGRIDAMLVAAQSESPISDAGDRWDANPMLLGVGNGVLELDTGTLRPGRPDDRITLHTDFVFAPHATCPRWGRFLDEVFLGDTELIDYIWRAVGYSLTGEVSEQCVFTCHGSGANGKSVFLGVLRALAGDYAANAPFSTFELHDRSSIPNDLAALAGRRLVTASETNEGARLNEARIKALSGGDPVTARFLHGEYFTFEPVAKFWLAVNHKPLVSDDSYGFWRRVRLIPFERRFAEDADPTLPDKLRAELPGILAWAVRGALSWQERGLRPPPAVTGATDTYRSESDPLADFLSSRCLTDERAQVGATEAYRAYKAWAADQSLTERETLSSTSFGRRMTEHFAKRHQKTGNSYLGVGLLTGVIERPQLEELVKGSVKGSERARPGLPLSVLNPSLAGENPLGAFTTRHPSSGEVTLWDEVDSHVAGSTSGSLSPYPGGRPA
jgi:putative DNA primase/helicase